MMFTFESGFGQALLLVCALGLLVAVIALIVRGRTVEQRVSIVARIAQWGAWAFGAGYTLNAARQIHHAIFNISVATRVDVSPFWPSLPIGAKVASRSAHVDASAFGDGFTTANVHMTGLSSTTRGLIALEYFAQMLAVVALCLVIARVARGIADGKLFGMIRAREFVIAGTIFTVTGLTALVADGLAQMGIMNEAAPRQVSLHDLVWSATADDSAWQVFGILHWSWSVNAPTWTFVAAVIAFVAAMVIRRGNQLETENAGLI
jgi:hypothetical protein